MRNNKIIIGFILILSLFFVGVFLKSKYGLSSTFYTISTFNMKESIRMTQLSDLHSSMFGDDNCKLIKEVKDINPDIIVITGDMVNDKQDSDVSMIQQMITDLTSIAPVYFSYGNQEKKLEEKYGMDIKQLFSQAGATVLDRSYIDTTINNQPVRIGGIYGYCQPVVYGMETHREDETEFLMDFQDTDVYKILLCHMPVCWIESGSLYEYDIDCVFSGHAHGGQVRIPFIGGLWAPDQGWFPGQECGVYETNEENWLAHREKMLKWGREQKYDVSYYERENEYRPSYLVLSRGLGNTDWLPRFNNVPEIVVVDFLPE